MRAVTRFMGCQRVAMLALFSLACSIIGEVQRPGSEGGVALQL